jgi:hypothetical protein
VRLVRGSQEGPAALRLSLMLSGDGLAAPEEGPVCLLNVLTGDAT